MRGLPPASMGQSTAVQSVQAIAWAVLQPGGTGTGYGRPGAEGASDGSAPGVGGSSGRGDGLQGGQYPGAAGGAGGLQGGEYPDADGGFGDVGASSFAPDPLMSPSSYGAPSSGYGTGGGYWNQRLRDGRWVRHERVRHKRLWNRRRLRRGKRTGGDWLRGRGTRLRLRRRKLRAFGLGGIRWVRLCRGR